MQPRWRNPIPPKIFGQRFDWGARVCCTSWSASALRAPCVPPSPLQFHFAIEPLTHGLSSNNELVYFAQKFFRNNDPRQSTNLGVRSSNLFGRATSPLIAPAVRATPPPAETRWEMNAVGARRRR